MNRIARVSKAIAGAIVGAATYVVTVGARPSELVWWAGLIIFIGSGYGIVWVAPANRTT